MDTSQTDEFDIKIGAVFSLATSVGCENSNYSEIVTNSVSNRNEIVNDSEKNRISDDCESPHTYTDRFNTPQQNAKSEELHDLDSVKIEPVSSHPEDISADDPYDSNSSKSYQELCDINLVGEDCVSSFSSSSVTVQRRTNRKRKPNQIFSDSYMLDYKGTGSLRNVTISLEEAQQAQKGLLPVKESTTPCLPGRNSTEKLELNVQTSSHPTLEKVNEVKSKNEFTKQESKSSSQPKRRKTNKVTNKSASVELLQNRVNDLFQSVNRKKKILYSELSKGPDICGSKGQLENITGTTFSATKKVKRSVNEERNVSESSSKSGDVSDREGNLLSARLKIKTEPITFDKCGESLVGSKIFQSPASELDIPYRVSTSVTKESNGGDYSTRYDRNWLIKGNSGSMVLASLEGQQSPAVSSMAADTLLKKGNPTASSLTTKVPATNSQITEVPVSSSRQIESRNITQKPSVKPPLTVTPPTSAPGKGETKSDVLPPDKENSNNALKFVRAPNYSQTVKEIAKVQNTKKFFQLVIGNKVVLIPTEGDDIIPKAYIVDVVKAKEAKEAKGSVLNEKSKPTLKIALNSSNGSNGKDNSSPPVLSPQEPVTLNFESFNEEESKPPVLFPETTVTFVPPPGTSKHRSPAKASPNLRSLLPNIISKSGILAQCGAATNITTPASNGTNKTSNITPRSNNNNVPSAGITPSTTAKQFHNSNKSDVQPQCSTLVTDSNPDSRKSSHDGNEAEDVSERIRKLREKLKTQQKDVENARMSIKTFKSIDRDDVT